MSAGEPERPACLMGASGLAGDVTPGVVCGIAFHRGRMRVTALYDKPV